MEVLDRAPADRAETLLAAYGTPVACAADILCDRHPASAVAFTFVRPDLSARKLTFGLLKVLSKRFAAALATLGVNPGDRVASLMDASSELVVAFMAAIRLGAIYVPLSPDLDVEAVAMRLTNSRPRVVICDARHRAKLALTGDGRAIPRWHTVVADRPGTNGDLSFVVLLAAHPPGDSRAAAAAMGGDGAIVQMYPTPTGDAPKEVTVPLKALASFRPTSSIVWMSAAMTSTGPLLIQTLISGSTTGSSRRWPRGNPTSC